jgi:hypothetical protein
MWVVLVRDSNGNLRFKCTLIEGALTVGRASDNEVRLPVPGASRHHGRITLRDDGLWYEDLGSSNGSFVGGKRVREPVPIGEGSRVLVAGFVISAEPDAQGSGLPEYVVHADGDDPPTRPQGLDETFHWRSPAPQLDRQLLALRRVREEARELADQRRQRLGAVWNELMRGIATIGTQLRSQGGLLRLEMRDDRLEAAFVVAAPGRPGGRVDFRISCGHPQQPVRRRDDAIWLRELGKADASFTEVGVALAELAQRVNAARQG